MDMLENHLVDDNYWRNREEPEVDYDEHISEIMEDLSVTYDVEDLSAEEKAEIDAEIKREIERYVESENVIGVLDVYVTRDEAEPFDLVYEIDWLYAGDESDAYDIYEGR